jgi:catechol 2,3-dioxygenase
MNTTAQPATAETTTIHPATRLGYVHYTVADLDRQIGFYQTILGFKLHWREGDSAGLGAGGDDLLRLTQQPGARYVRGTTGLYHTAFLVPTRWELAQLLKSIAQTRTPIQGMSNHGTHYAIYLPDAEGNGIELAWDFPQEQWPRTFEEMMQNNRGLHPQEVFAALRDKEAEWDGLDAGTTVGHVHLHVAHLPPTMHFYRDVLGFGLPMDMANAPKAFADSAIFFAAGDYHHHIGTNVWQGVGAPPPPPDATGLRYFTVIVPDGAELERVTARIQQAGIPAEETADGILVHDPARNGVLLTSA